MICEYCGSRKEVEEWQYTLTCNDCFQGFTGLDYNDL